MKNEQYSYKIDNDKLKKTNPFRWKHAYHSLNKIFGETKFELEWGGVKWGLGEQTEVWEKQLLANHDLDLYVYYFKELIKH